MTPACKDCRWSRRDWPKERFRRCLHDGAIGNLTPPFIAYCSIERDQFFANLGCCGLSARYFEPRIPLWRRVLRAIRVLP